MRSKIPKVYTLFTHQKVVFCAIIDTIFIPLL